jgi:hypothetical protein
MRNDKSIRLTSERSNFSHSTSLHFIYWDWHQIKHNEGCLWIINTIEQNEMNWCWMWYVIVIWNKRWGPCFVHNDQICDTISSTCIDKITNNVFASVQLLCIWDD